MMDRGVVEFNINGVALLVVIASDDTNRVPHLWVGWKGSLRKDKSETLKLNNGLFTDRFGLNLDRIVKSSFVT